MSTEKTKSDKEHNTVIYRYSTIVSYVMERFLDDFGNHIITDDNGIHVFSKVYKRNQITGAFNDYIDDFFKVDELHPYGSVNTVVVGTCYCHHNWLSAFKSELEDDKPKSNIVKNKLLLRYVFSDRKFICDEGELNEVFDELKDIVLQRCATVELPF